jgi:MFS family permease
MRRRLRCVAWRGTEFVTYAGADGRMGMAASAVGGLSDRSIPVPDTEIAETGEFLSRKRHFSTGDILRSLAANWRVVGLATMLIAMSTSAFYLITAYTPTFGRSVLHLADIDNLIVTVCAGFSNFLWLPVMGAVSDRVGRRPLLFGCTVLVLLTAYPALSWLTAAASFARLLAVELWLSFLYASYNAGMVVYLTELIPTEVRASGFSVAQSVAAALFGGFTPAICTYLIQRTGNPATPGLWLSFTAALGLAATFLSGQLQIIPGEPKAVIDHAEAN